MRIEDLQTVIVILFDCGGKTVTWVANVLELPYDFVSDTVIEWWQLKSEREREDERMERA